MGSNHAIHSQTITARCDILPSNRPLFASTNHAATPGTLIIPYLPIHEHDAASWI